MQRLSNLAFLAAAAAAAAAAALATAPNAHAAASEALRLPGPLSPRNASYAITATLDAAAHTVDGEERITFRNVTTAGARELVFHLYLNAFKNETTTFFRESRGQHRTARAERNGGWGATTITRLTVDGVDLTSSVRVDETLATVTLPRPLGPGETATIDVRFRARLPRVFARTGWFGEFFAVAQWFPKLAVFSCDGATCRWRAHQHHLNSEFFADFGVYDVTFRAPTRFVVAATGVPVGAEDAPDGMRTYRFHAEDVHDFALALSPDFTVVTDRVTDAAGEIEVALYSPSAHAPNRARHLAAARATLVELGRRLMPYPYRRLSIVDVPTGAEGAGGMEYPTLFFTFDAPAPTRVWAPEIVTAHELAHQWFYGIVASDEVEEAWLDEGFTEAATEWALRALQGRPRSLVYDLLGHRIGYAEGHRLSYRRVATLDPLAIHSYAYATNSAYGAITYGKTLLALTTLEGILGPARVEAGMRRYVEKWRFGHPRKDDFIAAFGEGAGADLGWYWGPVLDGVAIVDDAVRSIEVREKRPPVGLFDAPDGGLTEVEPQPHVPGATTTWISEVLVERRGAIRLPTELRVIFTDGSEKRERWPGSDTDPSGPAWRRFTYEGPAAVAGAELDPDDKITLDINRWNDGLLARRDPTPRQRLARRLESLLVALLGAVGL
jgi:hypothetical protein